MSVLHLEKNKAFEIKFSHVTELASSDTEYLVHS